jgi:hypothetical protein
MISPLVSDFWGGDDGERLLGSAAHMVPNDANP